MYKVMIVDDEAHARNTVAALIPWDEYGLNLVCSAANGAEALELIDTFQPDLVITDIEMPQMNGIELIRRAGQRVKFIVMSGYNDFEYVRTSMKLGALNYLLKPVVREELQETLMECVNILDRQAPIQSGTDETTQTLQDYTLWRLLRGQVSLQELREKSKFLGLQLRCPRLAVALFALPNSDVASKKLRQIRTAAQKDLFQCGGGYSFLDNTGNLVAILTFSAAPTDCLPVYKAAAQFACKLAELLQIDSVPAAVGPLVSNTLDLQKSYQAALNMQQYHFLMPEAPVLHPELSLPKPEEEGYASANPITVFNFLQNQDHDGFHHYLSELLVTSGKGRSQLGYRAIEISSILFSAAEMNNLSTNSLSQIRQDFFSALSKTRHPSEIADCLLQLGSQLLEACEQEQSRYSSKIRLALETIGNSYSNQNFSLKTLADTLNINSAYLGRQFKLETGEFFSDYLNTLRIQKAQELFLTTNLSASEISAAVGYTTTNYFYSIFKKVVGVSTSAYRNSRGM